MVAHIMADFIQVQIADPFTLPARLRPILVKISRGKLHKADALILIRDCLLYKQHNYFTKILNGGATEKKQLKEVVEKQDKAKIAHRRRRRGKRTP